MFASKLQALEDAHGATYASRSCGRKRGQGDGMAETSLSGVNEKNVIVVQRLLTRSSGQHLDHKPNFLQSTNQVRILRADPMYRI